MSDLVHERTDTELKRLERQLAREYKAAADDLDEKLWRYLKDFERKDKEWAAKVKAGEVTQEEYVKWRMGQTLTGKHWLNMRDEMAQELVNTDKKAADIINGTLPRTYSENLNYGVFEAEKASGLRTSFELVDEDTVRRLMRDDPEMIPTVKPDIPKDMRWNRQKITSAMTQGILQGESIPKIAKRLESVTTMDKNAAVRNARTYTTAAENGGRIDGYKRAKDMGIEMEQEWLAALDSRTRSQHRQLDGVKVAVGEAWEIDGQKLRYPADPQAAGYLIYNCRCTVVAALKELDGLAEERWSKLPEGQTYDEWKKELVREKKQRGDEPRFEDKISALREEVKKNGLKPEYIMEAGKALKAEVDNGYLKEYNESYAEWHEVNGQMLALKNDELYKNAQQLRRGFYDIDDPLSKFKTMEEANEYYNRISKQIDDLEHSPKYLVAKSRYGNAQNALYSERNYEKNADELAALISRVRPVGYDEKAIAGHLENSRSPMRKVVTSAYQRYPSDWIEKSIDRGTLTPKKVSRGYYSDGVKEIAISGNGGGGSYRTATHELGHRFEYAVPEIRDAEEAFYKRRTDGESLELMSVVTGNSAYRADEKTRKDDFIHPYMGKDYGGTAYELVSMGFEDAYCAPQELAKDPDMQQWIYGLLTLAGG